MCDAERSLGISSFFMMNENFLLYRRLALELLDCMKAAGKAWALYVFLVGERHSQVRRP